MLKVLDFADYKLQAIHQIKIARLNIQGIKMYKKKKKAKKAKKQNKKKKY